MHLFYVRALGGLMFLIGALAMVYNCSRMLGLGAFLWALRSGQFDDD